MNRKILYWTFQIIGWGLYFSFGIAVFSNSNINTLKWFPVMLVKTSLLLFLTHRLRIYIIKKDIINLPTKRIIFTAIIAIFSISAITNIITSLLMLEPFELITWEQYSFVSLFYYFLNESFIVAVWMAIYFVASLIKQKRQREIERWQLEVIAQKAQLDSLKSQINPHFIFNSLNNIRSLIYENQKQASDMITHLSNLLRYSIKHNDSGKETIKNELNIVNDYLKLQSIHLEERLRYSISTDKNLLNVEVPSMSIQLLVENGVKHGILDSLDGGEINIYIFKSENNAIIKITNTGKIIKKYQTTKVGIKNVSDRLKLLFGNNARLSLTQTNENLVTAKFNIPLK